MNCKQSTRLLSAAQDRPLHWGERLGLKFHLMMCRGCNHYSHQIDLIHSACARVKAQAGDSGKDSP